MYRALFSLSLCFHADFWTVFFDRALGAFRADGCTDGLSVQYEEGVDFCPLFFWKECFECLFGLVGGVRLDPAKAVADAVDMCVYGDGGLVECVGEHAVRGFSANAGQFHECVAGLRNAAMVFFVEDSCGLFDVFGFGVVESDAFDDVLDVGQWCVRESFRGSVFLKQGVCDRYGCVVFCACAQDGCDEHLEWCVCFSESLEHRVPFCLVEDAQYAEVVCFGCRAGLGHGGFVVLSAYYVFCRGALS